MEIFTNIPGEGNLIVASSGDLPTSAKAGTLATTEDTADVYVFDGSSWQLRGAGSGAGILDINGENGTSQTLVTGTSGTDFTVSSAANTHTFNLPVADATHTGKLSSSDWVTFNDKLDAVPYPLTAPDGSAAAPQYRFAGDPDTGMYHPADNEIAWATNGAQQMLLDVGGNLTISGDLAANNYPPNGNTSSFAYFDSTTGELTELPDWNKNNLGGENVNLTLLVEDAASDSVRQFSTNFDPIENAPSTTYTLRNTTVNYDINDSGFEQGTDNTAINFLNHSASHSGTGDIGATTFIVNSFDLGNGTDPINVRGFSYAFGFGSIQANVTINGPMQGYGFQPSIDPSAIVDNAAYISAFYDNANMPVAIGPYTSYTASPIIGSVKNNTGYVGINISPDIGLLAGNANLLGVNVSPTIDAFGATAGFTAVNINPTATGTHYATGVSVSMDNVSAYAGATSTLTVQDLTLTFNVSGDNNNFTLEYVNDGTAGAETVSLSVPTITVHMESGVSTAIQIKAALDGNFTIASNITTTITGIGSNSQTSFGPTNFSGGENPGNVKAGYFDGDVEITGSLTFGGALSIGKLNAFAAQAITDGGGQPGSIHQLITNPTVAANATIANADTLGVNTAALINIGDNATVTTAFLGIAALGLPAVLTMGTGSTVDRVAGALFALSLDSSATGGTVDKVSLCGAVAIPNGATTVNKLIGYDFNLPFGDPGTDTWGLYMAPDCYNWMKGSLKIGGSAGSTDRAGSGIGFEMEGAAFALASDVDVGFYGTTPIAQPVSSGATTAGATYTATEQAMLQEAYDALRALGLMS